MFLIAALLIGFLQLQSTQAIDKTPTAHTSSGQVIGFINEKTPNVAQFLGVPFAEHPVGQLRWAPPVLKSGNATINALNFSNNCPQFLTNLETVYSEDATGFVTPQNVGEDCLSVSIFAPANQCTESSLLPVIAWLYGGGFAEGGANVPYQIPDKWVERSQKHIVVSIK
jgi:acetylcholinesterase